jgi:hypothetical protein
MSATRGWKESTFHMTSVERQEPWMTLSTGKVWWILIIRAAFRTWGGGQNDFSSVSRQSQPPTLPMQPWLVCVSMHCIPYPATEHRNWLLYFSLPVLQGLLPDPYYTLLVAAMHLLLGESIDLSAFQRAERYLEKFYKLFATLYGMYNHTNDICYDSCSLPLQGKIVVQWTFIC